MTTQSINTEENSLNEENDILNICLADFGDNGIDEIAYYLQNINLEKIYDLISVYSVILS